MSTPPEIFKGRAFQVFDISEVNEFLLGAYMELGLALKDKADILVLNQKELHHIVSGQVIRTWTMVYGSSSIYEVVRKSLLKILDNDTLAQKIFHLDEISEDTIKIRVNPIEANKFLSG